MSATGTTPGSARDRDLADRDDVAGSRTPVDRGRPRRLSTETKGAFKTTEFAAYVAVLIALLIAGAVISGDGSGTDFFGASRVWLYATILTVGYMISRGLAKSGSREPYDSERS